MTARSILALLSVAVGALLIYGAMKTAHKIAQIEDQQIQTVEAGQ